jgi:uncharacterized repeat protein (TIGR04076 family)
MKTHSIKCEAIDVHTKTGICPGIAKTQKGETFIINGRTPESPGICSNAFGALSNAVFVMMTNDNRPVGMNGHYDLVCPHGKVTFRLSRIKED